MKRVKNYILNIGVSYVFLFFMFLVNPFNQGFLFIYPMIFLFLFKKDFLLRNLDFDFVLLSFISIIYALFYLFDPIGGVQYIIYYAIFPPFFYLFGKYMTNYIKHENDIAYLMIAIGMVFSFSAVVSVIINFMAGGFLQLDRSLPFFWTGQLFSATKMGSYLVFNMCLPSLLIANQGKSNIILKVLALIVFGLTLICVLRLGSRTQLVIMFLTTIVSLFYVIPRQSGKKNIILFIVLMGLAFYIYKNVSFDLNADWLTTFAGRLENGPGEVASGGGRTEKWMKSLENMYKKPLGWSINEFGFSHNLWLDALRASGIITFFLLIIFSVRSFSTIPKVIKIDRNSVFFNILVLVFGLAFFLLFFVEPVLEGIFSVFLLFCLFIGILRAYINLSISETSK